MPGTVSDPESLQHISSVAAIQTFEMSPATLVRFIDDARPAESFTNPRQTS